MHLTVSKIDQVVQYESGPISGSGKNSENKDDNFEPLTGSYHEATCTSKAPIGISRFNNTTALGGGPEPRGTTNSLNQDSNIQGPFAQVTSADSGISFKIPLSVLPGDVQIGNIVTMTLQRNP